MLVSVGSLIIVVVVVVVATTCLLMYHATSLSSTPFLAQ
jgi:hypothetical protein